MSALAPVLQAFFTDRLITQRDCSPCTIAAYRDTFRLLLGFAHEQTRKQPFELDIDDLDAPLIGAFLTHLEHSRGNSARTRNARLGAIHSFYRYAALEHPEHAHTIARIMAIPTKRYERSTVCYLDYAEATALLTTPDRDTWLGRRDQALLALMIQTGVRVSELIGLRLRDVHLGTGRHIRILGKGRKRRATPLTGEVAALLRQWITERGGGPDDPLFATRQGRRLSRHTVGLLVGKHADAATIDCPSLKTKRVTPHVLRHTAAMAWRAKGVDSPRSRCFSGTRVSRPLKFTSMPTPHSRKKRSPGPRRSASSPADTGPPMRSSPSSKDSDYVERVSTGTVSRQGQSQPGVGALNITSDWTYNPLMWRST